MDEASGYHPAGMAIAANGFGSLQEMLGLGEVGVGIAGVDESVEVVGGFPDAFLSAI